MDRGSKGGASSGAARGSRNQVTYKRPMPKFLREMLNEEPQDPLAAKRETATHHLGTDAEDRRPKKEDQDTNVDMMEIEALQKQGFNVVVQDDAKKEKKITKKKSKRTPMQRAFDAAKSPRITKKRSRLGKSVVPTSRDRDRKKLSFASDSETSSDNLNK
ncbi:hypothetical protein BWQ96_02973 [Gracilariopsis chorda]|uniref:DUF4604 domain-containing protein n=1 Tax=Gracilariopsis chorda TaxID=448386 RepID=A0A2V3IYG9_9FLOR|nr:hypothetical protein BWQ96_02973 [Gracilariopsis chorda]|eukprot:PXF47198.1 hypothetical protein BWQ96_02973 [Gracilariopsis chorda]